jgi:APA family basic amino acid/polyamine antiporter
MTGQPFPRNPSSPPQGPALRRDLGLLDAVGIGFGAIVGAGIFVVTGVAAGVAGPSLLLGLLVAGVVAAANALSSAQLAAAYPQSGGTYEYGYRVLSPWAGFLAGWMFLASKVAAAGAVGIGLAEYLARVAPGVPPRVVAVAAILLFTGLNYLGVRRSSRVNLGIVTISIGSLLLFVAVGAGSFDSANLRPFAPSGLRGILESAAILFFAYTGYARIATLGEEVSDPERTIPRAILITIFGAILLYLAVALVALGSIGSDAMASDLAPLHRAAEETGISWLPGAIALGGLTAMLGVNFSQILGLSRMVFAMARRGDLPSALAEIHPRTAIPGRAVLLVGGVAAIVAGTGTLRGVAMAASFAILVYYGIANLCAVRMPMESKIYSDAVPLVGLVICALLLFALTIATIVSGTALLLAGVVFRVVRLRTRSLPHG